MLMKSRGNLFFACFATQLLIVIPIILAGRLYIDDLRRSAEGELGWWRVGRPLADALFFFANLGSPAVDVFPLNQILGAGFIAFAGVLLAEMFRLKRPMLVAVATLPLGGQPYFLENLSYSFDSLTMTAGLLASVIGSYLVLQKRGTWPVIASALMIFGALCLYQQTVIAFFLIIVVVIASRPSSREHLFLIVGTSFFVSATAVLSYKLFITIPSEGYAEQAAKLWPLPELAEGIIENTVKYWMTLHKHWGQSVFGGCALIVIAVGMYLATQSFSARRSTYRSYATYSLILFVLSFSIVFSFGIPLFIKDVEFVPRFFIGVGVVLSLFSFIICAHTDQALSRRVPPRAWAFFLRGTVFLLAYTLVVTAFAYGRASALQKEFEISFLTRLVHDIDTSGLSADIKSIAFHGAIPMAATLKNTGKKFPAILSLVPRHINNDWYWGSKQMKHFGLSLKGLPLPVEVRSLIDKGALPPLFSGMDYELFQYHDLLVVYLKNKT